MQETEHERRVVGTQQPPRSAVRAEPDDVEPGCAAFLSVSKIVLAGLLAAQRG
jgi:hypothetical protein